MKAMIFAAGLGTRLKPLTNDRPKALVTVAGKPMLEHVILKLKAAGCDEIVINVHHFADQILAFLEANNNFGIKIHISDETDCLRDTGGGLQKASSFLVPQSGFVSDVLQELIEKLENKENGPQAMREALTQIREECYLLHNVDILTNFDLEDLIYYHQNCRSFPEATLLVSSRPTSRYLLFDDDDRLCGWINKETNQTKPLGFKYEKGKYKEYAYSGIQMVYPSIFSRMPAGKYSIIDYYLSICHIARIQCYVDEDLEVLDLGKPEALEKAEEFLKRPKKTFITPTELLNGKD